MNGRDSGGSHLFHDSGAHHEKYKHQSMQLVVPSCIRVLTFSRSTQFRTTRKDFKYAIRFERVLNFVLNSNQKQMVSDMEIIVFISNILQILYLPHLRWEVFTARNGNFKNSMMTIIGFLHICLVFIHNFVDVFIQLPFSLLDVSCFIF